MHTITLIPGDGIGPSITGAVVKIVEASGLAVRWDRVSAGVSGMEKHGTPLDSSVLDSIRSTRVALKGPLTTPVGSGFRSINVALRKEFDLYVNLRPVRSFAGVNSRYSDIDLTIIRENTEGLYIGEERYADPEKNVAEMVGRISRVGSERVIRFAFEYARTHGRKKVTVAHKANILKLTSGMFLEVARAISSEFSDVELDEKIIDNMAMQMVLDPHQFDIVVTTNLFGDILSDLASGLVGGLGLAPGANIGKDAAIFEAVHGSAPDIAGKNIANPTALLLGGVMMLRHLGENEHAARIERALTAVISEGKNVTRDLNSTSGVGTAEMAEAVIHKLK
ncbi:MAG: isocitrate/isopropylmalate family dehydrogenase [Ignavibacteria bacterium]|nr:isocitrate/isopropylmalate family dehydrogenase [Ignavibacteria bacterium]